MASKKKYRGLEQLKSSYGRRFVLIWEIGLLIFVIVPIISTVIYSLSDITTTNEGLTFKFVGLEYYKDALYVDPTFTNLLTRSLTQLIYSVPAILVISLVVAILLNREFKGRLFFRMIYFLPVIIATGVVMELILKTTSVSIDSGAGVSEEQGMNMINVSEILSWLNLSGGFVEYFQKAINSIFTLVWNSGIQIILFISGMQAIPDSLYEVSKVEGATKWEEFWFITIPMLSRIIILVTVFTMVEVINDKTNDVMSYIYKLMSNLRYSSSSAMLWIYFGISGLIIGIVLFLFTRYSTKKWE